MKVRIRDFEDMAEEFGLDEDGDIYCYCSFTTEMREYCGKIIEIDRDKIGKAGVFEYDGWYFDNGTYDIFKNKKNDDMIIRIRDWSDMMEDFGLDEDGDIDCYGSFTTEMREYCGKIIGTDEVTFIKDAFMYDDWTFTDDMYEVIEE